MPLTLCRAAVMKLCCLLSPTTLFAIGSCLPPSLHRHSLHPAGLFIISICSCLSLLRDMNSKHLSPAWTCRSQPQPAGDSGSRGAAPCSGGSCAPPASCQPNSCPPKCQGRAGPGWWPAGDSWGGRGRWVLGGVPSLHLQYSDLGRLQEEGYQGTSSMSSSSKSPRSTCIRLVLAGTGHTGAFLAVPLRGYHPLPRPSCPHRPPNHPPAPSWAWQNPQQTAQSQQRSPCHPASRALGGCCSSDGSSRHVAAPKPACPGMPHLAQVAAREEGTAMTVPGRPWPRMGGLQHPWVKRILDGRYSSDGAGNPKNVGILYAVLAGLR